MKESTLNKVGAFSLNPRSKVMLGRKENHLDFVNIMDEGKILLVNLSKGDLGEDNSVLLGSVLVNLVLIGALRRRSILYSQRRPFHLIVDKFQNFAGRSFAVLQSEARKYAVDVIVAHQFRDQLDEFSRASTLNVANFIVMRVSGKDSHELAIQFDNTPPDPDIRMEPIYQGYDIDGEHSGAFVPVELASGGGRLSNRGGLIPTWKRRWQTSCQHFPTSRPCVGYWKRGSRESIA